MRQYDQTLSNYLDRCDYEVENGGGILWRIIRKLFLWWLF